MAPTARSLPDGAPLLFDANPLAMWVHDVETLRFLAVNDAAVDAYGYSRDEFLAMTVADIHPLRTSKPAVWRHRRKDGSVLDVEVHSTSLVYQGRPARLVAAQDVTEARFLSAALRLSEERFRSVFAHAPLAQMTLSVDGRLSQVNAAFCAMVERDERDLLGARLDEILCDGQKLTRQLARAAGREVEVFRVDDTVRRAGGQIVDVQLTASAVRDDDGVLQYVVALMQDVSEHRSVERKLAERAMTDPLTGLPNRLLFLDRLDKALSEAQVHGASVTVLFIDLDRFKLVNDTLGHAAGDQVLLAVTRRLRNAVSGHDTIARFGGDEFTVLCQDVPDVDAAMDIAKRLLDTLTAPVVIHQERQTFTVSIGVAVAGPDDHVTGDFLIQGADSAMYRAKEAGRNRCELFDQASRARTLARLQRADEMRSALEEGELCLRYQPLVTLTGEPTPDVEALLRWHHPTLGLLGPPDFIAVAEETRLIVPMGTWVIERACRDVANLEPAGDPLRVSVNLSASQLARSDLVDVVRVAVEANGIDARRLCLEITETVLMEDLEWSINALLGLKALGVRLAIDDFGTGYSSLNYLRRLPVDVVKIDQSFVAGLGTDAAADAIVAAVINLSHALGLTVVAEGVEREEQLVALRALGCDQAQGFYWSPPVSLTELRLVNDVSVVEQAPVDVRPLLGERADVLSEKTGRAVVVRGPDRLPAAMADVGALRSICDHLLDNAARFSGPERPIVVSATADRRWVRISVSDFGAGMTEADVARCFEPFWHGPQPGTGAGVGLYIVRSLVEKMGGQVWVRSSPGKGATFTVALPRSAVAAPDTGRGEPTVIREFMRQLGVPQRRGA